MAINYKDFIHPLDKKAMDALKALPGFDFVVKKFMNIIAEKMFKIETTSSFLKLGPNQLPHIYDILVKVCKKLEIDVPELYLSLDRTPNAYTMGDTEVFIVLHSGLLETMTLEQIETVIAHECGHILCHHVLYRTMGRYVLMAADMLTLGLISKAVVTSLQYAFFYWMRCSEFSADRVSAYYHNSSEPVVDVMLALSGGTNNISYAFNKQAFFEQAKSYKDLVENYTYNKFLEFIMYGQIDHPLNAYRAYEIDKFYKSNGKDVDNGSAETNLDDSKDTSDTKYKLSIRYNFVKSSTIKLINLFTNTSLKVKIGNKSLQVDKNASKSLKVKSDNYCLEITNNVCSTTYDLNLQKDTNLVVTWDSDSKIMTVAEE